MSIRRLPLTLASVPVLVCVAGNPAQASRRGVVLLYHGLGAAKESNTKELDSLAARGFLAIGVDNVGHGQRRDPDFERRFEAANRDGWIAAFLRAVEATAQEVPQVIDALDARGWFCPGRLGICGISMGGCIAYAALRVERRLVAATPILATPRWQLPWPTSPHLFPADLFPVAILSQTAGTDENVPPRYAREFHQQLRPHYAQAPERERYIEHPGVGHFMPEATWHALWEDVLRWFERFLGDGAVR